MNDTVSAPLSFAMASSRPIGLPCRSVARIDGGATTVSLSLARAVPVRTTRRPCRAVTNTGTHVILGGFRPDHPCLPTPAFSLVRGGRGPARAGTALPRAAHTCGMNILKLTQIALLATALILGLTAQTFNGQSLLALAVAGSVLLVGRRRPRLTVVE